MLFKTPVSLLAEVNLIVEKQETAEDYLPSPQHLDLPEYEDEDGGRWVHTGKVGKHFETGKTTYEYAKYDKEGHKTGERHYKDAEGNFMGESKYLKEESAFARAMKKAIDAEQRGDIARLMYHLKNAKMARYGLKSTEISKHKDLLDKYTELRDKYDTLNEAKIPVQHATDAVHKVLGQQGAVKFLTHLRPGDEKHTSWDKINDALVKQGVKPQHIASIATHVKPAQYEEVELDEAKGKLMYKPKHTMWAVIPKSKKEFVKTFDMNKHEAAEQYARETAGKLVKIDQAGRILKEKYASEDYRYLGAAAAYEASAPDLLKAEMPLVRHIEKELASHGYEKGTKEYDEMFAQQLKFYRKFGNIDAINKHDAQNKSVSEEVWATDSKKLKAMTDLPITIHKSPYEGAEVGEYTEVFVSSPATAQQFAKYIISKGGKVRLGKRGQEIYVYHKGAGPISKRDFRMAKIEDESEHPGAAEKVKVGDKEEGAIKQHDAAAAFKVGDKVQVKLGGKWHDAEVTDGPHKLSGHIEAKFMAGKKTIKTRFDPKTEVKKKLLEDEDLVHFFLDTERAYEHVMDKFGHVIDWDQDTGRMTIPRKHWAAMQELALAADGIGAIEDE